MRTIYNSTSLRKHNVAKHEVDDVYATGVDFDLPPSIKGNDRIMLVGLTANGRLLEIGVEFLADGNEHIFHASDATKPYQAKFQRFLRH